MGGKEKYGRSFSVIHKAICKYGVTNFTYKILRHTSTEAQALELERTYIAKLRQMSKGIYNITDGGEGMTGHKHSKKSRRAISVALQGEKSANAHLTEKNVRSIYKLLASGAPAATIAKLYSVSKSTVNMIAKGKRWAHLYRPLKKKRASAPKGERCAHSILNGKKVRSIRRLLKRGQTRPNIAKLFRVSITAIQNIGSGRTWSHIK